MYLRANDIHEGEIGGMGLKAAVAHLWFVAAEI